MYFKGFKPTPEMIKQAGRIGEYYRWRACWIKKTWDTKEKAEKFLPAEQKVYRCKFCKKWHRATKGNNG